MSKLAVLGLVAALVVLGAFLLPVLVVAEATGTASAGPSLAGGASSAALATIPGPYLADFEASGARFAIPWGVLAGIYKVECDFGQSQLAGCNPPGTENGAGAQGPGQFLPTTWRVGLRPYQLIPLSPPTTSNADGYATDGDGDGVANPWDPADAVASTARLLAANGGATDISGAVFAYNHSQSYVDEVLSLAASYTAAAAGPSTVATSAANEVATVLDFAEAQLGKPYQWGGSGPSSWDCSGLVQAAYRQVGIVFTHDAAAQYTASATDAVALDQVQPGDLVFFGASDPTIEHVGIVVAAGEMIDAPHTGAVVRVEPYDWSNLLVATDPLG